MGKTRAGLVQDVRRSVLDGLGFEVYVRHLSLPGSSDGKRICLQCGRPRFDPWVMKIPCRRKWQPTPVFLPGKFHGWRNLLGYSPWGCKESDKWLTAIVHGVAKSQTSDLLFFLKWATSLFHFRHLSGDAEWEAGYGSLELSSEGWAQDRNLGVVI